MVANTREKRRWIFKICSQESHTDPDISWSSSDSEEEIPQHLKRLKGNDSHTWLNFNTTPPKSTPEINRICSQDTFLQSPVISQISLEDQSPILSQIHVKEQSPVISRNRIIRKLKARCKRKIEDFTVVNEKSKESPQSELIIDSTTPVKEDIHISPVKSEVSQGYQIECVSRQCSTEIISESNSFSYPQSITYSHTPPKRKRFKKGGLASQLQKALGLQASSAAIWQHEVFISKSKGLEVQCLNINFSVNKKWAEYGCFILECQCKSTTDTEKLATVLERVQDINLSLFLLITGSSNASNVCLDVNNLYQLFQPFSTKIVIYHAKETICVLNASRFAAL